MIWLKLCFVFTRAISWSTLGYFFGARVDCHVKGPLLSVSMMMLTLKVVFKQLIGSTKYLTHDTHDQFLTVSKQNHVPGILLVEMTATACLVGCT